MLYLDSFEKGPNDTQDFDISIVDWLAQQGDAGATVTGVLLTPGLTLTSTTISNGVIKLWVSGGVDKMSYTIRITVTTFSPGVRIKQFEVKINVRA